MRSKIETDYEIRYGYKNTCRKVRKEVKSSCEGLYQGEWSLTRVKKLAEKLNVELSKSDTYNNICDKLYNQLLTLSELECVLMNWNVGSTGVDEDQMRSAISNMLEDGYVFDGEIGRGGVMGTVWKVTQNSASYAAKLELHATTKLFEDDDLSSILPEWHEIFKVIPKKMDIVVMELLETVDDVKPDSNVYEAIDGLIEDTDDLGYEHDDVYPGNILTGPVKSGDSKRYNTYMEDGVVMKVVWGDVMSLTRAVQDSYKTMKEQFHETFDLDENDDEDENNDDEDDDDE